LRGALEGRRRRRGLGGVRSDVACSHHEHAQGEENVDFPRLREILGEDGGIRLARKISREKALVL
jgi:hypothetical protein